MGALNMNNFSTLAGLNKGTKILLTDGSKGEFVRLKRKNFEMIINDGCFNVPVTMFKEVLEAAKENNGYKDLKKGDLFYITTGKNAELYIFEKINNGRIIGINPINKCVTKIALGLYAGNVKDLK